MIKLNPLEISIVSGFYIILILLFRRILNNKSFKYSLKIIWGIIILRLILPYSIRIPISRVEGTGVVNAARNLIVDLIIKANQFKANFLIYNIDSFFPKLNRVFVALLISIYTGFKIYQMKKALFHSYILENNEFINSYLKEFKIKREIQVLINNDLKHPITYGIIKPKIIIQSGLLEDKNTLKHVLTHEVIHIKELDILWNYLKNILICIYWYNPLIWLMGISLNEDIEILCDKLVITNLGNNEENKKNYCITMFNLITSEDNKTLLAQELHPNMKRMMIIKNWEVEKVGIFLAIVLIFITSTAFISIEEDIYPQTISSNEDNKVIFDIGNRTEETTIGKYNKIHEADIVEMKKPNISHNTTIEAFGGSKSYTFNMSSWIGPSSKKFVTKIDNLSSKGPIDYKIIIEENGEIIYSNSFYRSTVLTTNYSKDNRKYRVTIINTSNKELSYDISIFNHKDFDAELYVIEDKTYFDKNDTDIPKEIFIEKDYQGKVYSGLIPIKTMVYNPHNNSWVVKYSGYIYPEKHKETKKTS